MFLILSLILPYVETNECFYDVYDDDVTNLKDALDYRLDLSPLVEKEDFTSYLVENESFSHYTML